MKSRIFDALKLLLIGAFLVVAGAQAADTAPDVLVKNTTEEVLAVIQQTNDRQKLSELAETKVLPHFDFKRMTRLAVGKAWTQATPEQRQALEKQFRDLLVRTYTNALATRKYEKTKVDVAPPRMQSDGKEATVKSRVIEAGRPPIPIDYEMIKTSEGWKVFDIVVENVSLVTNYRSSFAEEINRSGVDGLIKTLAEKNRTLAAEKVEKQQ